jgi:serine/threonine-protein kinase
MNILRRRLLLFLFALVLGFVPALHAQGDDKYAAIAYSPTTGKWGYGCNYSTKAEAIDRAKSECGEDDVRTNWCKNAWISLAISKKAKGGWGSAWGETRREAEAAARKECRDRNPDAHTLVTVSANCEK